jgi:pyruvate dehydrogenase E1 component alpha subunit
MKFANLLQRVHPRGLHTATLTLPDHSFRGHNCSDLPSPHVHVTKDELLAMYRQMHSIRRMELAAEVLYKADLVRGYCHLAIGQVK